MGLKRLQWLTLWDRLRLVIQTEKTSWGRNDLLARMDELERQMIRETEEENETKE